MEPSNGDCETHSQWEWKEDQLSTIASLQRHTVRCGTYKLYMIGVCNHSIFPVHLKTWKLLGGGILQRGTGKEHAMQHPLQFRAIHVNNCFLFQWKCTARQGKQYFLPIKRKKLDRQASDRLSKDKTQINLFLRKQVLFLIYGGKLHQILDHRPVLLLFQHLL